MYDFARRRSDFQIPGLIRHIIEDERYTLTIGKQKGNEYFAALFGLDENEDQEFTGPSLVGVLCKAVEWLNKLEAKPLERKLR